VFMQVLGTKPSGKRRHRLGRPQLILKAGSWWPNEIPIKRKLLASKRQLIAYLLIVSGSLLCTGVLATYSWMYWKQRSLLRQWNEELSTRESLTKLSIPRIQLEDVVLEGVDAHSLLLGPSHMLNSVEPGIRGNAVIAGHRDTFFRKVHKLRPGDDIYVLRDGHRFHYKVTARKIVRANDLSVLKSSDKPELTLITCYPTHAIGPAPERLIVVGVMTGPPHTVERTSASAVPTTGAIPVSSVK
jgi:sortase A